MEVNGIAIKPHSENFILNGESVKTFYRLPVSSRSKTCTFAASTIT